MICVTPAAHPTFCSFELFTSYMSDACKQGWEELVAFLCCCCWLCWSCTSSAARRRKKKEKQQLPICVLPASILQQNQPKQTGNTPSPIHPPPLSFYPLWSSHLTALRFLQSFCSRETQDLKSGSVRATADCRLPSSPPLSPLIDSPVLALPPSPRSLPLFPPASNSQSSALPVCLYSGKKWWSKKEKRRSTVVSAPQKM